MVTEQQISFWKTFGYLVFRNVFPKDEIDQIRHDFDAVMAKEQEGKLFTGEETQTILWFVEHSPSLARLVTDERIYNKVEQLLGPGFIWCLSDGNYYVGDTQWHGGAGEPQVLQSIKIAIYPDTVTRETGCLRVIPGSHIPEYQKGLKLLRQQFDDPSSKPFGVSGAEMPATALESQPGDMVFFSEDLWHSSFGGRSGRRMFTLIYYGNPDTEEKKEYIRQFRKRTQGMFHPHEMFVNSTNPKIRDLVHVYSEL